MSHTFENHVFIWQSPSGDYPCKAPFAPSRRYPEHADDERLTTENHVYDAVRETFHMAALDAAHYGTQDWNPLRELIHPGETVLLKPNLVKETHPRDPQGWRYVLTHGSVIRAVADYVFKALGSEGRVVIADAPQTDSSFDAICKQLGLDVLADWYRARGFDCQLTDLRKEEWENRGGVIVARRELHGDPHGYVAFNLGDDSEFADHSGEGRYFGADYDEREVNRHHSGGRHEYLIAGSAIRADVIFSLPKLKTHKKAGVTCSLKNLVGVNGDKNWLPHHTEAGRNHPGDERPSIGAKHWVERAMVRRLRHLALVMPRIGPWVLRQGRRVGRYTFGDTEDVVRSGNWWGNDTTWRMCLDLNKIILYGNQDGTLRPAAPESRKRHYALVDGIIAGEARGPLDPDPVAAGMLVFGVSAAHVDAACTYLMGFDPDRIPIVRQAFRCRRYAIAEGDWRDVQVTSNRADWNRSLSDIPPEATFHFAPHFGWKGHVELEQTMQG
jgi:uncharacterized protein (DUF362 family)